MNRRTFVTSGAAVAAVAISGCGGDREEIAGPVVETALGKIRGAESGKTLVFRGIRYGAPTSGARRYMPAAKPEPWTGVQDATEWGEEAPQAHPHTEIPEVRATVRDHVVGEDCLRLNVWTPAASGSRPVMVWFHGGGFSSGNGGYTIYDGANLAEHQDVVMVTVNHRLNTFGFLDLTPIGGGVNVGITDCVAALEWVRDNIALFGGDPRNVTIFGQSGGGGKVSTLMAMPAAEGLFHKAIIQSGSYIRGVTREEAAATAKTFLDAAGAKTLAELQAMPMDKLIEVTRNTQGLRLSPVVDGTILPADPFNGAAPGISSSVPLLTGTTETEITFFPATPIDPINAQQLFERAKAAVPGASDEQVRELIEVYRKGRPHAAEIELALIIESDARFHVPVLAQAELKTAQAAPVFMYYFTWRTPVRDGKLRSLHCLDIPFATATVDGAQEMTGTGQDRYTLEAKVSGAWAAFARNGTPNHIGIPGWPAFDLETRRTMVLDNECKVVENPHGAEREAMGLLRKA